MKDVKDFFLLYQQMPYLKRRKRLIENLTNKSSLFQIINAAVKCDKEEKKCRQNLEKQLNHEIQEKQ